ncbi:MAG TPA: L-glutamine--2-deoxy-scyllo-inosose aminotransferase KanB, partial [Flavisolibacter sp.]|nr:L-glutamine--2-deoxy-scyllo-inosose aminotransferase KanB [Flavisolibacter sp.]
AIAELKAQGTAGNFYWFDNNWHYIRKWDHLKTAAALYPLHNEQRVALEKLASQDFSASDEVMSRCVSTSISLLWTDEQIKEKGEKMVAAIQKVLAHEQVNA